MECLQCNHSLGPLSDYMTFIQDERSNHLTLKPEDVSENESTHYVFDKTNAKKQTIHCKYCKQKHGKILSLVGVTFHAISLERISINDHAYTKKSKWNTEKATFEGQIEERKPDNFHIDYPIPVKQKRIVKAASLIPDGDKAREVDITPWWAILKSIIPKAYQLEGYLEAVQNDIVFVLPTGYGKTLVAAMVLAHRSKRYPQHTGLMVVEKIPLVDQHCQNLRRETGMKVMGLCGENVTRHKVDKVSQLQYDVLVMTVESVLVRRDTLPLNLFHTIVMDECHHARGDHSYARLLKVLKTMSANARPRLLGLTATPIEVRKASINANLDKLDTFMDHFPNNCRLVCPDLGFIQDKQQDWKLVEASTNQQLLESAIFEYVKEKAKYFPEVDRRWLTDQQQLFLCQGNIQGRLRMARVSQTNRHIINELLAAVACVDLNYLLGVKIALPILKENNIPYPTQLNDCDENSKRLDLLMIEILKQIEENAHTKILVFVKKRDIAKALHEYLLKEIPHCQPLKMVGHGGEDGMLWNGPAGQNDAIYGFNYGESKLMVATSIVEEGLDIPSCDLVIRFSSNKNLIRHLQTRGRARKSSGRFIILGSHNERFDELDMLKREQALKGIIKMRSIISSQTKEQAKDLLQEERVERVIMQHKEMALMNYKIDNFSFKLYAVDISESKDLVKLKSEIEKIFQNCHVDIINNSNGKIFSGCEHLFPSSSVVFLLGFTQQSSEDVFNDETVSEKYLDICLNWSFRLSILCSKILFFTSIDSTDDINTKQYPVEMICFGRMEQLQPNIKISYVCKYDGFSSFSATYNSIEYVDITSKRTLQLKLASTYGYALATVVDRTTVKLSIPYQTPPHSTSENVPKQCNIMTTVIIMDDAFNGLCKTFPLKIFTSWIEYEAMERNHYESLFALPNEDFDLLWLLKSLDDSMPLSGFNDFKNYVLEDWNKNIYQRSNILLALEVIRADGCLIFDMKNEFLKYRNSGLETTNRDAPFDNTQQIHNAIVTPSERVIAGSNIITPESRLIRMFPGKRFITVTLRGDNGGKVANEKNIDKMKEILANGIEIIGHKFQYLCASGSQLRDHKANFVEAESFVDVQKMRDLMIHKPKFSHISKYSSRLGLFATTGTVLGDVDLKNVISKCPDIEAVNGTLLTDGCGKISKKFLMDLLKSKHDIDYCAIQIRLAGAKGVLVIVDNLTTDIEFQNVTASTRIILRPSMVKFDSLNPEFLLVTKSQWLPLTLNREIITLLDALKSRSDTDFDAFIMALQNERIQHMADRLHTNALAQQCLKQYLPQALMDCVADQFNLTLEPFWFSLLQHTYLLDSKYLREKTNIPIKNGCRLMGVADPTFTLEPECVFCFIEHDSSDFNGVLTGNVIIYRNPCLHPGDVRLVKAVENPRLKEMNLKNVLVFSVSTQSESSLPDKCSGGDLDGDQFSIIWDQNIILNRHQVHPPLDYQNIGKTQHTSLSSVDFNNQEMLAKFFTDNMKNDALGRVANMHLALSDHLSATHKLATALSKSQSVAVDFPKTGIVPLVPKEALDVVKQKGFPDFMEKEPCYKSEKVLGRLYRYCQGLMFNKDLVKSQRTSKLDHPLVLDGRELFDDEVKKIYKHFCIDMKRLMSRFEIKNEAEIVLCEMLLWPTVFSSNRGKASASLKNAKDALWRKYLAIFYSGVNTKEQFRLKASSWYTSCYEDEEYNFKSFAWIIHEQLTSLKTTNSECHTHLAEQPHVLIGVNCKHLFQNFAPKLVLKFERARTVENQIQDALPNEKIKMYGSASVFVSGDGSDIDLLVYGNNFAVSNPKAYLEGHVVQGLQDNIDNMILQPGNIPIVRCKVDTDDDMVDVDISCNRTGYLKTICIRSVYKRNPNFFVVFWTLVHWARLSGILKNFKEDISLLPTAEFYAIILKLVGIDLPTEINDINSDDDLSTALKEIDNVNGSDIIGHMILKFFRSGTEWPEEKCFRYEWPNGIHTIEVSCSLMKVISAMCLKALHIILYSKDMTEVNKNSSQDTEKVQIITKRLSKGLSLSISTNFDFFKTKLLAASGVIKIEFSLNKNSVDSTGDYVLMVAHGSRFSLNKLLDQLVDVSNTQSILRKSTNSGKYFMDGSQWINLFRGDKEDRVIFKPFTGKGHKTHRNKEICGVEWKQNLNIRMTSEEYWKKLKYSLAIKLKTQLAMFPKDKPELLESLQFVARFGLVYVIEPSLYLSDLKTSVSMDELDTALLKGRTQRHLYKRDEFNFEKRINLMKANVKSDDDQDCEMVPLPKINQSYTREKQRPLMKKKNTLLASSFVSLWPEGKKVDFIGVLKELGFVIDPAASQMDHETDLIWNISLHLSLSFEATMLLDEDFCFKKMHERRVTWVHGSILDCDGSYDVRTSLYSKEQIDDEHSASEKIFPNGIPYDQPLFHRQERTEKLLFSKAFPIASRSKVMHLRQSTEQWIFVQPKSTTEAIVNYCKHYYMHMNDIVLDDEGMEMSLRFHTKELQQMVKANSTMPKLADKTAEEVLSQIRRATELVTIKLKEK